MLAPFFEKLAIKLRINCIHTVSESSKDDLVKFGAKKPIYVIHNAIDETIQNNTSNVNPLQFVYVSRLVFYKNLEVVINAISIARKTEPEIKLVIVGDGPHKNTLEKLVNKLELQSNVKFSGYVSSEEKSKIISESSTLVFPSLCEGFGLVILEAFLQKKPVLVSNVRPMSDIVENEKTGYLIDPHDINAWTNQLLECIQNPQKILVMGENGKKLLESTYNQEIMYQKIMQMYQEQI